MPTRPPICVVEAAPVSVATANDEWMVPEVLVPTKPPMLWVSAPPVSVPAPSTLLMVPVLAKVPAMAPVVTLLPVRLALTTTFWMLAAPFT